MRESVRVVDVAVVFRGVVRVRVPARLPLAWQAGLAERVALAKLVASADGVDAPEDAACQEFAECFALSEDRAGKLWDAVTIEGVGGAWEVEAVTSADAGGPPQGCP